MQSVFRSCREGQTNGLCRGCQITWATAIEIVVNQRRWQRAESHKAVERAERGRERGTNVEKREKMKSREGEDGTVGGGKGFDKLCHLYKKNIVYL